MRAHPCPPTPPSGPPSTSPQTLAETSSAVFVELVEPVTVPDSPSHPASRIESYRRSYTADDRRAASRSSRDQGPSPISRGNEPAAASASSSSPSSRWKNRVHPSISRVRLGPAFPSPTLPRPLPFFPSPFYLPSTVRTLLYGPPTSSSRLLYLRSGAAFPPYPRPWRKSSSLRLSSPSSPFHRSTPHLILPAASKVVVDHVGTLDLGSTLR